MPKNDTELGLQRKYSQIPLQGETCAAFGLEPELIVSAESSVIRNNKYSLVKHPEREELRYSERLGFQV